LRLSRFVRNVRNKGRAQVAVELFLGMTLFILVLYWMNYFVATQRGFDSSLYGQEQLAAAAFVEVANSVCAGNTSVTVALPCISVEGRAVSYSVFSSGAESAAHVIPERAEARWASKKALCNFSGFSVKVNCSQALLAAGDGSGAVYACVNQSGDGSGFVNASKGACT